MNYELGSEIEIPGLEVVMEYGDAADVVSDRIPGAYQINDQSTLEHVRLSAISGIADDPDSRDARESKSDLHGENTGRMFYDGRTIGLTGVVQAGSIPRMRDEWRRFKSQFRTGNKDLLLHSPFEVPIDVNSIPAGFGAGVNISAVAANTITTDDTSPWTVNWSTVGAGTISLAGGVAVSQLVAAELTITSATAAGDADVWTGSLPWNGEDAFFHVMVCAQSGSIAQFDLIGILERPGASSDSSAIASQVSPVAGTWYVLSGRLTAAQIAVLPRTTNISLKVRAHVAGAGSYVARYARPMLVLLDATDPTPKFLDGTMNGFVWDGAAHGSTSRGPVYASNMIADPRFEDVKVPPTANQLNKWAPANSASVTVNELTAARQVGGTRLFYDATKDATTTSRDMGIVDVNPLETTLGSHLVATGRSYRFSATVNITQLPATGVPRLAIEWYGVGTTLLSTSFGATLAAGITAATVTAAAPAGAVSALVKVVLTGCTTSSGRIKFYVLDPCLVETTNWDPGSFDGTALDGNEIAIPGTLATSEGARRLIPRPWLIRKVRKGGDGPKAPEQQSRSRAWRDFTMSLRAADPRIYTLDERQRGLRLVGTSQLVIRQAPDDFTLSTNLAVPTGWTYEGNFVTFPGTGSPFFWSQAAYNTIAAADLPVNHPNGGVGIRSWDNLGAHGSDRPASDLSTRMYRSSEAFTYANPKIILGGAPSGGGRNGLVNPDPLRGFNITLSAATAWTTYLTALLKRVSGTTWIEVRWAGLSKVYSDALSPGLTVSQAFEIWCSHNTSGTLTETKLAGWDYASYDSTSGIFPFLPTQDEMYLVSWMLNNTVFVELWRGYPSIIDTSNRLESFSFALPAPLQSIVGSAVAGSVGHDMYVPRGDTQSTFNSVSNHPPFVHYFEASKADVPPVSVSVPVIGEVDTPQQIVLTDMVDPVISITTPEFEGDSSLTTVARFSGSITATNPLTIDLANDPGNPMIFDALGNNAYNLLVTGSRFQMFRPGINYVTVQAKTWGTSQEHVRVGWKDALT